MHDWTFQPKDDKWTHKKQDLEEFKRTGSASIKAGQQKSVKGVTMYKQQEQCQG